jgi:hypothetical protein
MWNRVPVYPCSISEDRAVQNIVLYHREEESRGRGTESAQ